MGNNLEPRNQRRVTELTVCEVDKTRLPSWVKLSEPHNAPVVVVATWLKPELVSRIGLPKESICGFLTEPNGSVTPEQFIAYSGFVDAIHNICRERLDPQLIEFAALISERKAVLIDQRSPDVNAEIPTEDIIGTYEIENSVVGKFTANPSYRLVTGNGCMQLTPWLRECLYSLVATEGIA